MKQKLILYLSFISVLFLGIIFSGYGEGQNKVKSDTSIEDHVITFTAMINIQHQTIDGFGASDAWSILFVGKNWPLRKRERLADLLFSTDFSQSGNPKGIGLSIYRYNIGAGSMKAGTESGIPDPWRRTESFINKDGSYNWNKQEGHQWFMKAAKKRGVRTFIGFANSPPVMLTKNGKAYGEGDHDGNIPPENYDKFADYLVNIAKHYKKEGIPLDYISPINEPQVNWNKSKNQEGSSYQNDEMLKVVAALDRKIKVNGLDTKILIPEAAGIKYLYDDSSQAVGNQASYFFGVNSKAKKLSSVSNTITAHSYGTTWPVTKMIETRQKLWESIHSTDPTLKYWMTEYCLLENNKEVHLKEKDLEIDPALYLSRVMHYDLTVANASSWQWWVAVSPYNVKDGLIYIDKNKYDGEIYESKMLWAMGNYSRFIRPGAIRLTVKRSDRLTDFNAKDELLVSAFLERGNDRIVFVVINYGFGEREIRLNSEGANNSGFSKMIGYITSSKFDLSPQFNLKLGDKIDIPPRSIVTFIGNGGSK